MGRKGVVALIVAVLTLLAAVGAAALRTARPVSPSATPRKEAGPAPPVLDFPPGPSGTLEGRVLEGDRPAAGASILVTSDQDGEAFSSARCSHWEERSIFECGCAPVDELIGWRFAEGRGEALPAGRATAAVDGTFRIDGLAPGRYAVWAEASASAAVALDVPTGVAVELVLRAGIQLAGTAQDEHEAPVVGARIAAIHRGHSRFFETTADAAGRFQLGPLPADGEYVLVGAAAGHLPDDRANPSGDSRLVLRTARRVEGRVLRDGQPVAGAEIQTEVYCSPLVTRTDALGRFVLERLRPERTHLSAFDGLDGGFAEVQLDHGDRTDLVISLRPGGLISGEVVDDGGAPVPGVNVEIASVHEVSAHLATDSRGRFALAGLPASDRYDYSLWLHPPDGYVNPGHRGFRIQAGTETRARFVLLRASALTGVVTDEAGHPIAGAEISGHRAREGVPLATDWDAHGHLGTTSDRRGHFSLEHAFAGRIQLSARAKGFLEAESVAVAPGEVTVILRRGGTLAVEVLDERGAPAAGAHLNDRSRSGNTGRGLE